MNQRHCEHSDEGRHCACPGEYRGAKRSRHCEQSEAVIAPASVNIGERSEAKKNYPPFGG